MSSRHPKSNTPPDASSASGPNSGAQVDSTGDEKRSPDVLLVHGVTEDGAGLNVIRRRNEQLELGALHPARAGRPIHGELVKLRPRPGCPLVCDVDVQYSSTDSASRPVDTPQSGSAERRGPAHVATDAYRTNWDAIWARQPKDDLVN